MHTSVFAMKIRVLNFLGKLMHDLYIKFNIQDERKVKNLMNEHIPWPLLAQ